MQPTGVWRTIALAFLCMGLALKTFAGPLEDARQLIDQKRYGEVDKRLGELLEEPAPSVEALQLSLEAALADGRLFTARRRCEALLDNGGRQAPQLIYTGAHLAGVTGDTTRETELLALYTSFATEKSDTLQRALFRLAEIGNQPQAVAKYIELYGANDELDRRAIAMLPRLYEKGEAGAFAELTDLLLAHFGASAELSRRVTDHLRRAADGGLFANLPGEPADGSGTPPADAADGYRRYGKAAELILKHPIHNPRDAWTMVERSQQITPAVSIRFHSQCPQPLDSQVLGMVFNWQNWRDPRQVPPGAAKAVLSWEPMYRQFADRNAHKSYVDFVAGQRDIFRSELDAEKMAAILQPLCDRYTDRPRELASAAGRTISYSKTTDEMVRMIKRLQPYLDGKNVRWAIEELVGNNKHQEFVDVLKSAVGDDPWLWFENIDYARQAGQHDLLKQTVRTVLLESPGNINIHAAGTFLGDTEIPPAQRVAVLTEFYEKAGYNKSLQWLVDHAKSKPDLADMADLKKLASSIKPQQLGSDPLATAFARVLMVGGRGKDLDPVVHKQVKKALEAYGAKFPAGRPNDKLMGTILQRYYDVSYHQQKDCITYVKTVLPHVGANGPWYALSRAASGSSDQKLRLQVIQTCIQVDGPVERLDSGTLQSFATPAEGSPYLLEPYYARLSVDDCWRSVRHQTEKTRDWAAGLKQLEKILAVHRRIDNDQTMDDLCYGANEWSHSVEPSELPASIPTALAELSIRPHRKSGFGHVMKVFERAGRTKEAVDLYLATMKDWPPLRRFQELIPLFSSAVDQRDRLLLDEIVPLGETLAPIDLPQVVFDNTIFSHYHDQVVMGRASKEMQQRLAPLMPRIMTIVGNGADLQGNRGGHLGEPIEAAFHRALAAGEYEQVLWLARLAIRFADDDPVRRVLTALRDAERWELLFIVVDDAPRAEKNVVKYMEQLRGIAAAKIPGIFPVDASHPAFPVYVASSELARGNEERAWELLRDHVPAFAEQPLQFDLNFTVWAVDKLRRIRGADDALLKLSRSLCDLILAEEQNLDAQFAASVTLIRADAFRDMGRLEASELEYKSMLSNPRLQETQAGRSARYRLVELMIMRGNMSGASVEVDRWLAFPDPQLHTQAYFFKALMAFEDEDYKVCREMLNKVFEREWGHEEARLLEGEWRKKTRALEDTDVYAGRQIEMSQIQPGQELKLSIHDRNLSVIGEGAFIPVLVTTSSGQDREVVSLYPAPRTPNLFRSQLSTRLGDADPGNLMLEVNGADTIQYQIDPAFVRERGLDPLPAKTLQVVDDAWLSSSSGRLLTEEEQKELALKRQVAAIRGEKIDESLRIGGRTVRPGNPLYVMVRDRDRDVGPRPDTLTVAVSTSSGDVLAEAPLTETGPHTGIFRGSVDTAVPLPRALASDSAEGADPSAMINSSQTGLWSSRPDAAPDKWVEVDTMGSHLVKQVSLDMPAPEAIKQLTLFGAFAGEPIRIGQFPAGNEAVRDGLTLRKKRQGFNRNEADLAKIRAVMRDYREAPLPIDVPEVTQAHKQQTHTGQISGTFYLDEGRPASLAIQCEQPGDQMVVYVLVDGRVVVGGFVRRLDEKAKEVYLAEGPHRLDVYFVQSTENDLFAIGQLASDGQFETLPKQWFDMETNEGLRAFLQNKAVIQRTDSGYVAQFESPMRLRKLRWQFGEYAGASVRVSEIGVTNDKDEAILPVPHDFSTGLTNETLEVAPGDSIAVTYRDRRNSKGGPRTLSSGLGAGFANAQVTFTYELKAGIGQPSVYADAYRFMPGEQLTVTVHDPDADVSPQADMVDIVVRTATGEELTLQALEAHSRQDYRTDEYHSGVFHAILKTTTTGTTGGDSILVAATDHLEAAYMDRENTSPGVPTLRASAPLPTTADGQSRVTFFRIWSERVPNPRNEAEMITVVQSRPLTDEEAAPKTLVTDASHPIRFEVKNAGRALHAESEIEAFAVSQSELDAAKEHGRKPRQRPIFMKVGGGTEADPNSIFKAELALKLGSGIFGEDAFGRVDDSRDARRQMATGPLPVLGADTVHLTILGPDGKPEIAKSFRLATEGDIGLFDKNYEKPDTDVHMGEKFFVQVVDPDQDLTSEHDQIAVAVRVESDSVDRTMTLTETLPHSGIFSGSVRTMFAEVAKASSNGSGDVPAAENATDDSSTTPPTSTADDLATTGMSVRYGDSITFTYDEKTTVPGVEPGPRSVTGTVLLGADGQVHLFSKRFRDMETGARVQFRMAECLFELAKEYRKVKNADMASGAIARGKQILEEAMQDYPNTTLVTEGQYLLANLYQELAAEEMAAENEKEAIRLYQQAVSRFSSIISTWPDSPYAARAQFHKAICLEKLGDHKQSSEEYVRLCYAYPDSPLVADATIRLATHFYRQGRFDVSGRIYESFARQYPSHEMAPKVLFMAAASHMKQGEVWSDPNFQGDDRLIGRDIDEAVRQEYLTGAKGLDFLIEEMKEEAGTNLRAQAMYWCGIAYRKAGELPTAYLRIKQVTFEYPESKWARMARGLLLQDETLARQAK